MAQQVEQQMMERVGREDETQDGTRCQPESAAVGWFPARPRVESPYRRREPAHEFDFGHDDGMENGMEH